MTTALIVAVAFCLGAVIRRWWATLLPLVIGCVGAAMIGLFGHGLRDTPIAFLVAMTTMAVAIGILVRTFRWRHSS